MSQSTTTATTSITTTTTFEVTFSSKPIPCTLTSPDDLHQDHDRDTHARPRKSNNPALIFTHGAGGDLNVDAIRHFRLGFATQLPIVCFQGNMNLTSRVKMFNAVVEAQPDSSNLGGRSMGARAATMAITESTDHLVLVSYPLHTAKDLRDAILLALPPSIKVIFVIGDRDSMCDLHRLEQVREKMKCKTWRVVVQGADHGMHIKPRAGSADVVKKSGEVVAAWIMQSSEDKREGLISWDDQKGGAAWSGWCANAPSASFAREHSDVVEEPGKRKEKDVSSANDQAKAQATTTRSRKRRKI